MGVPVNGEAEAFGVRLRAYRQLAGLSQEELAERSGLSVRAIGDLERGHTRSPYRDSVNRLADALGLRQAARTEFVSTAGRRLARTRPKNAAKATHQVGGTSQVVPRQLPGTVPTFVGRSSQLAALSEVLHQPGGTAVITAIAGTAGVGKTTLAVHWAHQVAAEFPDGQLYTNLRGFDPFRMPVRPADAVRVFLDALGIPADQLPQTLEAQLGLYRSLLVGKRMLIVLDNARDAEQVRPLLPGSPTCRVVVTSRNQLIGLTAIEAAHPLTLDILTDMEAHQLLRHRVGADRLTADPESAARIISACGHLPLALCIVAARAATLLDRPLAHIATELATHPSLDAFTDHGDPAADIRATFSWSYLQLDAETARAFRLAGLHPGADLERYAIAALTGSTLERAGHVLDALAGASLVQPAGPDRYGMHDLLHTYARELAVAKDGEQERRAALTRLFDCYLSAAATAMDAAFPAEHHRRPRIPAAAPVPRFAGEQAALAWLDAERPTLVAVAAYTAEHGWASHTIRLSETLFRYLDTAGRYAEARIVHDHARRAARSLGDRTAEANALISLGLVDGNQGRNQQAGGRFEQALALHSAAGHQDGQARALNYLGLVHLVRGQLQQATTDLQRAVALFDAVGERTGAAYARSNLGVISRRQGDYRQANGYQQQALAAFRDLDDRHGAAATQYRIGLIELSQERYPQAADNLRSALTQYRELGDRQGEGAVLNHLGLVHLRQGHHEQGINYLRQALTRYRELNDQSGQTETLNGLGEALLAIGQPAEARAQHSAALDLAARTGVRYEQARAHDGLANAYQAGSEPRKAQRHWREALGIYTDLGAPEAAQIRARLA